MAFSIISYDKLDEDQKDAVDFPFKNPAKTLIVYGGPGTGKSTIAYKIAQSIHKDKKKKGPGNKGFHLVMYGHVLEKFLGDPKEINGQWTRDDANHLSKKMNTFWSWLYGFMLRNNFVTKNDYIEGKYDCGENCRYSSISLKEELKEKEKAGKKTAALYLKKEIEKCENHRNQQDHSYDKHCK